MMVMGKDKDTAKYATTGNMMTGLFSSILESTLNFPEVHAEMSKGIIESFKKRLSLKSKAIIVIISRKLTTNVNTYEQSCHL